PDKNFIFKKINFNNNLRTNKLFFEDNYNEIEKIINTTNLFYSNENYLISNCKFLEKIDEEKINFLNNINKNNIILTNVSKKIDSLNLSKIKNIEVYFFPELNMITMKNYINKSLYDKGITILNFELLHSILIPNSSIIDNEINKLSLLNIKVIDDKIIKNVVYDYSKENIFDLIIFLLNKNYIDLFKCLDNLLFAGNKIETIISVMSEQLFNLKNYIEIFEKENILESIHQKLNIEQYKIKKFYNIINLNSSFKINSILLSLLDIDLNIKKKNYNSYIELKKFFLEV
ncbi:MAG: DNA polymerase III subunit delta, partial [Mycoplasmoidaceae bacterium]